jgi:hypothetical protein
MVSASEPLIRSIGKMSPLPKANVEGNKEALQEHIPVTR